jgi:hypothetical protein
MYWRNVPSRLYQVSFHFYSGQTFLELIPPLKIVATVIKDVFPIPDASTELAVPSVTATTSVTVVMSV